VIETRTVDYIPEEERHGAPRDLFFVWFGANMNMTTLVTGALLFTLGLSLFWSVLAILTGVAIGSILVAAHAVQGPRLGIPQMIQSRAQFGVYGAIVPMLLVMFIYFGYSVSNTLIVTQSLSGVVPWSKAAIVIMFSGLTCLIALIGYRLIHATQRWLTWISILLFGIVAARLLSHALSPALWLPAPVSPKLVFIGVGLTATFTLSCAPYVADYSRYLPSHVSSQRVFWATYAGMALSMSSLMLIGALLAAETSGVMDNAGGHLAALFGPFSALLYGLIVYGLLCINVFNFYGAFMAVITTVQPFGRVRVTRAWRAITLGAVTVGTIAFSLWGQGNFADLFLKFIFLMSYALIPWTAINLVDYYFLRRGRYEIEAIFDPDGTYGRFNPVAIAAFLISIAAEVPFISDPFYTGPLARALGSIDLAWLVGVLVGAASYYLPMRLRLSRRMSYPPAPVNESGSAHASGALRP